MKMLLLLSAFVTAALAGTGSLPQLSPGTIRLTHVNDIRSALSGDFVPRDGAGTANDNGTDLGETSHRWAHVYATQNCVQNTLGGNAICFNAPASPNAYNITPATALPSSSQPVWISSTGQLSYPTLGQITSSATGNPTTITNTTGMGDVSGLTLSLTTRGRPVFVGIIGSGASSSYIGCGVSSSQSTATCNIQILRSGTVISLTNMFENWPSASTLNLMQVPSSSIWTIDAPAAGTYTYKVQANTDTHSTVAFNLSVLVAYEL